MRGPEQNQSSISCLWETQAPGLPKQELISLYKNICVSSSLHHHPPLQLYVRNVAIIYLWPSRTITGRDGYRLVFIRYRYITDTFKTIPVPKRCRNRYFYKKLKNVYD